MCSFVPLVVVLPRSPSHASKMLVKFAIFLSPARLGASLVKLAKLVHRSVERVRLHLGLCLRASPFVSRPFGGGVLFVCSFVPLVVVLPRSPSHASKMLVLPG